MARKKGAETVGVTELLAGGGEDQFRDFMAEIFAAAATLQVLRRSAGKRFGLSSTELAVVVAISKLDQRPSIRQLADHLHVAATNVTVDVNRLVRSGLAAKAQDPDDARAIKVSLTPAGHRLMTRMTPVLRDVNNALFFGMRHTEMVRISELMRHVVHEGRQLSISLNADKPALKTTPERRTASPDSATGPSVRTPSPSRDLQGAARRPRNG